VTPYLGVRDAAAAIDFYREAFGAEELLARITDEKGRVGHAELRIGHSVLYLADEHPEFGHLSPTTLQGSPVAFMINVPNVDEVVARAVAAGATLERPVQDQLYGDRTGTVADPYGFRWTIATHVEDVSEEEMLRRAAAQRGSD
jgi:PhnB protein